MVLMLAGVGIDVRWQRQRSPICKNSTGTCPDHSHAECRCGTMRIEVGRKLAKCWSGLEDINSAKSSVFLISGETRKPAAPIDGMYRYDSVRPSANDNSMCTSGAANSMFTTRPASEGIRLSLAHTGAFSAGTAIFWPSIVSTRSMGLSEAGAATRPLRRIA